MTAASRRSTLRAALLLLARAALAALIVAAICFLSLWWLRSRVHSTDLADYPDVRERMAETVFVDAFPRDLTQFDVVSFSHKLSIDGALTELRVRYADDAELARIIDGRDRDAFAAATHGEVSRRRDLPRLVTWDRGEFRSPPDDAMVIYWRCSGVVVGIGPDLDWGGVGYVVDRSARECVLWAHNPPQR